MHGFLHGRQSPRAPCAIWQTSLLLLSAVFLFLLLGTTEALAHAVTEGDKGYIQEISGINLLPLCTWVPNT